MGFARAGALGLSRNAVWSSGDYEIAVSRNGGKDFETKLRLKEIEGPVDCPAGTSVAEASEDVLSVDSAIDDGVSGFERAKQGTRLSRQIADARGFRLLDPSLTT